MLFVLLIYTGEQENWFLCQPKTRNFFGIDGDLGTRPNHLTQLQVDVTNSCMKDGVKTLTIQLPVHLME